LPSGKSPRALVWTPERVTEWRRTHHAHIEELETRLRRLTAQDRTQRCGSRAKRLDAYISAPRPSRVMVWTPALARTFLERAERHRLYALYYLITFRGLRRGEACGLRWSDLDLDRGVATVRWQITQNGACISEGKPKSAAGEGQVVLDKATVKVLRAHKASQNTDRLAAGDAWEESGHVFTTETGQSLRPGYVSEQFEVLCMEAGLPPIRLHDLRHGAASILLAAGYDMKVVQETLRLSSITIAADTYTSLMPELARQSAEDAAAVILNAATRRGAARNRVSRLPTSNGPTTQPDQNRDGDTQPRDQAS
jgi:integrase